MLFRSLGFSNLISIAVLAAIYGVVFKVPDFSAYVVYLGIGLVIWNTMASSIQAATGLFKTNADNIKNTNINPIFYTLEEWSFQLQTFAQSFGLVILALSLYQPTLIFNLLVFGLLPVINLLIFIYWFPLLIGLLGAPYEDFFQLIPIALQLLFLLSPILYKHETLGSLAWSADLNPLFRILDNIRHSLIHGHLRISDSIIIFGLNIIGVLIAVDLLRKRRALLPFIV